MSTGVIAPDTNKYYIMLNRTSNAGYLAMSTLFIGIAYIVVVYLFSFIYNEIGEISNQSEMVSAFLFNPRSGVDMFHHYIYKYVDAHVHPSTTRSNKCAIDNFSNMSEITTIQLITDKIEQFTDLIQYWFHRLLLIFYINKNTISSTQKINRTSFMDIKI